MTRLAHRKDVLWVAALVHPLDGSRYERPGQLLVRQPFAPFDGVHEMPLDRVAGIERNVVAALHHAGAAAFAEQPFGRNRDVEIGIGFGGVQRRKQPGPAGAENQDVGLEPFERHMTLEREDSSSNCHPALSLCLSMSFSQNRFPLLRDMLQNFRSKTRARGI